MLDAHLVTCDCVVCSTYMTTTQNSSSSYTYSLLPRDILPWCPCAALLPCPTLLLSAQTCLAATPTMNEPIVICAQTCDEQHDGQHMMDSMMDSVTNSVMDSMMEARWLSAVALSHHRQ